MAQRILATLYDSWASNGHVSSDALRVEQQWDKRDFIEVLDRLEHERGLIKHYSGYAYDLNPMGVIYAEDNDIVPETKVNHHRELRAYALMYLANLYDERGSRAHAIAEDIARGAPVKHTVEILVDLRLLAELDYIEAVSSNSYRITTEG